MKKIYCDKILIPSFVIMFFIFFDITYFVAILDNHPDANILLITIINIIINLVGIPLISYLFIRRFSRVILLSKEKFEFIGKDESYDIKLSTIKNYMYSESINGFYTFTINQYGENTKEINLTKGVIKKIARLTKKEFIYIKNDEVKSFKQELKEKLIEFKKFIYENLVRIIVAIIGVIISVVAILLHEFVGNIYITIGSCIICYLYAVGQLLFLYLEEYTIRDKILTSIIGPLVIFSIMFIVGLLIFHKVFIVTDVLLYCTFILPAFVVVILMVLLIIAALSYA